MTARRLARPIGFALAAMTLSFAGCSGPGAIPTDSATPTAAASDPSPSTQVTPEAQPTESFVTDPPMAEPPAASISVEGGDAVIGELGSFTWQNSGSDAPWLPGNPIHIGSGERLTLALEDPVGLVNWTVSRAPAGANGSGEVGVAVGTAEPVTFAAPPPGSWSVSVEVWFADNLGSAAYYWLVEVD